ncbi:hypothetical protein BH09ACT8_BH09ACT8_41670 [soil metagenome]
MLALYDEALPAVYGYFVRRCGDRATAEDLTLETVADARGAIYWYVAAFGAVLIGEPIVMDDSRIGQVPNWTWPVVCSIWPTSYRSWGCAARPRAPPSNARPPRATVPAALAFEPGRVDGWQISPTRPMGGVAAGSAVSTTVPMWTVISEPAQQPHGLMAECTDDQDDRFYLGEF